PRKEGWPSPSPIPIRDTRLQPIQQKAVRRLKVYFQGLQKQALRAVRNPVKSDNPPPEEPWDREVARQEIERLAREIIGDTGEAAYAATKDDFGVGVDWTLTNPWLDSYMGLRLPLIQG